MISDTWAPFTIVNYIFQKIIHPQDPTTTGSHANIPPFKISLENKIPCIDLSKTLQKAYQAKAPSKRSRMTLVSASQHLPVRSKKVYAPCKWQAW